MEGGLAGRLVIIVQLPTPSTPRDRLNPRRTFNARATKQLILSFSTPTSSHHKDVHQRFTSLVLHYPTQLFRYPFDSFTKMGCVQSGNVDEAKARNDEIENQLKRDR